MSKSEQPIYILVIDKKKMKLEDAGIDDKYLQEYSFFQKKFKKFPIVKQC